MRLKLVREDDSPATIDDLLSRGAPAMITLDGVPMALMGWGGSVRLDEVSTTRVSTGALTLHFRFPHHRLGHVESWSCETRYICPFAEASMARRFPANVCATPPRIACASTRERGKR